MDQEGGEGGGEKEAQDAGAAAGGENHPGTVGFRYQQGWSGAEDAKKNNGNQHIVLPAASSR